MSYLERQSSGGMIEAALGSRTAGRMDGRTDPIMAAYEKCQVGMER